MPKLPALPGIGVARLLIGLFQGVALYLLYLAADSGTWTSTNRLLFAPLALVAAYIPLSAIAALGNLRPRVVALWSLGAALILAGLTVHDIDRAADGWIWSWEPAPLSVLPSLALIFAAGIILFIAQALLVAGDAERRLIASYPRYFDGAWKQGIQIALCAAFVGLFWMLLGLGAGLFQLIKIDYFRELIQHRWFAFPATTLAIAGAIHVSDVRSGVVRGMRGLVHVLMSWLLPILTIIVAAFLASLPFTGLAPLWGTRHATALLLTAAAALILLVNAAYQDGLPEHRAAGALRFAGSAAALMLSPLVAIAAYALALRVGQHGWTVDRVIAAACVSISAIFAAGYGWAALQRRQWLKPIEMCNVTAAFASLAAFVALSSPIADPARLAAASQVARLESGEIAPDKFDFASLRFDTARYGKEALTRLSEMASGPNAVDISSRAKAALKLAQRTLMRPPLEPVEIAANIAVYPQGRALPDAFMQTHWGSLPGYWLVPPCMKREGTKCEAYLIDLDGDGVEEIIVSDWSSFPPAAVFKLHEDHQWRLVGTYAPQIWCHAFRESLRAGQFKTVPSMWQDLEIGGRRVSLSPDGAIVQAQCPSTAAATRSRP